MPVCLPFAINNPQARLHLAAGKRVVNGAQALAFVRLRENVGEGSDTQRIQRQQYFLAAVMQKLKSTNLLSQPSRIFNVVRDVAKSLTTDSGLDLSTMLRIADSMKSLSSSSVQLVTVPVVPYAGDPTRRAVLGAAAGRPDVPGHRGRPRPAHVGQGQGNGKAKTAMTATAEPTVSPAKVSVQVLNGSGVNGVAGSAATALTAKGFTVTGTGPAANYSYTSTTIQYSSAAQLPEVNTLKAALGSGRRAEGHRAGRRVHQPHPRIELPRPEHRQERGQGIGQDAQQPGQELRRYHRERQHLQGLGGVRRPGQPASGRMSPGQGPGRTPRVQARTRALTG